MRLPAALLRPGRLAPLVRPCRLPPACAPTAAARPCGRRLHTAVPAAGAVADLVAPGGPVRTLLARLGMLNTSRSRLAASGFRLYETVADGLDYEQFSRLCEMPDTFFSWFLVTELHVWMLCVRLADDGAEGKFCRNQVITAMWQDLEMRAKKLGPVAASLRNEQIQQTSQHFKATLIGYDEGLLEDSVLAGALWRRLFSRGGHDATRLETLVAYVRRELARLDQVSRDSLLLYGHNSWGALRVPPAR